MNGRCNECGHSDCCGPIREHEIADLEARIQALDSEAEAAWDYQQARIAELEAENQRLRACAQAVVDVFREECGNTAAAKQMAALLEADKDTDQHGGQR